MDNPDDHSQVHQDDHLSRSVTELGDPDALFRISRTRFLAKLTLGILLVFFGIVGNVLWWVNNAGGFDPFFAKLLIALPVVGIYLLIHMYRERGLFVLIYPTGLLRLRRGEVASFLWGEILYVQLKVQQALQAEIVRDPDGVITACWLPAEVPTFQLWNAKLTVAREDGVVVHFGPALTDYDRLAEEVQKRTFAVAWPLMWTGFLEGKTIAFGDLTVTRLGLHHTGKFLSWQELKEIVIQQGKLSIKQSGKWLPWLVLDISTVQNPHVLYALVTEAQRHILATLLHQPKPGLVK